MQYSLTSIPREEFEHLITLVDRSQRSRYANVKPSALDIQVVTEDYREFDPMASEATIRKNRSVGSCLPGLRRIWIKPGRLTFDTRVTAIHEIAHIAVPNVAHAQKWRQVFGVAYILLCRETEFVREEEIRDGLRSFVSRYRNFRLYTPKGKRNDWLAFEARTDEEVDRYFRQVERVK